jgi:hypothetical protein
LERNAIVKALIDQHRAATSQRVNQIELTQKRQSEGRAQKSIGW